MEILVRPHVLPLVHVKRSAARVLPLYSASRVRVQISRITRAFFSLAGAAQGVTGSNRSSEICRESFLGNSCFLHWWIFLNFHSFVKFSAYGYVE